MTDARATNVFGRQFLRAREEVAMIMLGNHLGALREKLDALIAKGVLEPPIGNALTKALLKLAKAQKRRDHGRANAAVEEIAKIILRIDDSTMGTH